MIAKVILLVGESVVVLTPDIEYDEHMEEVVSWRKQTVENVLVAPGATSDVKESARPSGTQVALTLGFPKTFSDSLRGCHVLVRAREYAVIGDPQPNMMNNCPTKWWYTAEVEAVDG